MDMKVESAVGERIKIAARNLNFYYGSFHALKNIELDLILPGMKINTGPNDYRVNKQLQMMKFNGERWELFGPIIEDAGPAG